MKRQAYPQYKPSGVAWMGEIPEHWDPIRLRYRAKINPSRSELNGLPDTFDVSFVPMELVHEYGGLSLEQTRPLAEVSTGYTYFREGDVLAAKITPCFENGKGAVAQGLINGIGFGTTELHVLRCHPSIDRHFLFYVTISHAFRNLGTAEMYGSGGQKRVPEDFIKDFRQPVPPVNEQRAIAVFLDRETARIDMLIEKKQRQIDLLQEKRSTLISHAVTKGLDLNAKMKDSGIEWLGEIPEHWEEIRFKYVLWLQRGHDLPGTEFHEGKYPVCGSNGCIGYHNQFTSKGPGVTVGRSGSVGEVNYIDTDYWAHNTALYVKEFRKAIPRFSYYLLKTLDVKYLSAGTAVGTLNRNYIHDLPIAIPVIKEQRLIAAFLDQETERIDALIIKVRGSSALLREYRAALISAAVKGKIDVRKEVS